MREKLLINEIQAAFKHWLETKNVCFFQCESFKKLG